MTKRGWEEGGGRIVLIQRKVGNMGNLGRMTVWTHREKLVNRGRVHNLTKRVGCTLTYSRRGRRKGGGAERGRVKFSRWITLWFLPDRIPKSIWKSHQGEEEGVGGGLLKVVEGEGGLGVVRDDHHPLADRFFTVGGAYESLILDAKRAIDIGTSLYLKRHERGMEPKKPEGMYLLRRSGRRSV